VVTGRKPYVNAEIFLRKNKLAVTVHQFHTSAICQVIVLNNIVKNTTDKKCLTRFESNGISKNQGAISNIHDNNCPIVFLLYNIFDLLSVNIINFIHMGIMNYQNVEV
jgi:hypothetical protein